MKRLLSMGIALIISIQCLGMIVFSADDSPRNLARGARGFRAAYDEAGSTVGPNGAKPTGNATDGDVKTVFGEYGAVRKGSFWIDLEKPAAFNKVVIYEPRGTVRKYSLYHSKNARYWEPIVADGSPAGGTLIGGAGVTHVFEEITARYVKIDVTDIGAAGVSYGYDISEFEVYYDLTLDKSELSEVLQRAQELLKQAKDKSNSAKYSDNDIAVFENIVNTANEVNNSDKVLQTKIVVTTQELKGAITAFLKTVTYDDKYFDQLREWHVAKSGRVTLDYKNDLANEDVIKALESSANNAQREWDALIKDANRTEIFENSNPNITKSGAVLTTAMQRLRRMALAYSQDGNSLQGNAELAKDTLDAFDFVIDNWYNESSERYGNWWDWNIGIALAATDVVLFLHDQIPKATLQRYAKTLSAFVDPSYIETWTGANRMHEASVEARIGMFSKSGYALVRAGQALEAESRYNPRVPNGAQADYNDGYYSDGSFIQHGRVSYTGSYGKDLIIYFIDMVDLFEGTPWEASQKVKDTLYEWIYNAYAPLIYDGHMMDMVNGRAIVRKNNARSVGQALIGAFYKLSVISPEPHKTNIQSMVKGWLEDDNFFDYKTQSNAIIKQFMNETDVASREKTPYHKSYPLMDRIVHAGKDYAFGLSMFSSRILAFEQTNNENLKGWYTGTGMTYIYNSDSRQYVDDFWYTVNMYRLAGTTVTTAPRSTERWQGEYVSDKDWVGSSVLLGRYSSAGMELDQWQSTLSGKKSYFMFDDEIVMLGADISSQDSYSVETIVENRMLTEAGDNAFSINGKESVKELGESKAVKKARYAHLAGPDETSGIGYYFPKETTLNVLRETRTEFPAHVSSTQLASLPEVSRNFLTMWFDHGAVPRGATYEYVILPGKTAKETKTYASNPAVTVIANSPLVQSVKHNVLGVLGANFWEDKEVEAGIIKSYNKASVTLKQDNDSIIIAVSDPTTKGDKILLEIAAKGVSVESKADNITVLELAPKIKLEIDVSGMRGGSSEIKILTN